MSTAQFNVAGITFRLKDTPELARMRPFGPVTVAPEPDNKFDPKALKVLWGQVHLGYVPKGPYQDQIHALLAAGSAFSCEVASCGWREDGEWNNEGVGDLSAITLSLSTDGEQSWFLKDGEAFIRITSLLHNYSQGGRDNLDKWMCKFGSYEAYSAEMNRLAALGTAMHAAVESFFSKGKAGPGMPAGFHDWLATEKGLKPLSMEERVWDTLIGVCGQYDLFAETEQGRIVYDWKSAKVIRFQHRLQACFYGKHKGADFVRVIAWGASNKRGYSMWTGDKATIEKGYAAVCALASVERLRI